MRNCVIFTSLFLSFFAGNAFAQERPAQGYVPDMTSPGILQQAERFLDEYIDPNHPAEYREAVGKVFLTLLNFVDQTGKPERTGISQVLMENGETAITLSRIGTGAEDFSTESNSYASAGAITLRNKNVVALNGMMKCVDYEGGGVDTALGADDALLKTIAQITTLEKLELGGGTITDQGIKQLASLAQLKSLVFCAEYYSTQAQPDQPSPIYAAFDSLHGLVNLEELALVPRPDFFQSDADSAPLFRALTHYPRLKKLSAGNVELTPENLRQLAQCRELESLSLAGTMPEPCLAVLVPLTKLSNLYLDISGVNESFEFPRFPALESLQFHWANDTPEQEQLDNVPVITFTSLPKLKEFRFYLAARNSQVVISHNPKLQFLHVGSRHLLSDPPLVSKNFFTVENLPELTQVRMDRYFLPGAEFHIANIPQLRTVVFLSNVPVKLSLDAMSPEALPRYGDYYGLILDGGLAEGSVLPDIPGEYTYLRWLQKGSPAVLLHLLRHSPKVKQLELGEMEITPEIFEAIIQMTELERLTLFRCTLPEGIDISQLKTLKWLLLSYVNLPAELGHFPVLNELRLDGCTSPEQFTLINMPALNGILIESHTGCKNLFVKDMPRLAGTRIVMNLPPPADIFQTDCESIVFENCPALQNSTFPYRVRQLDLRGTQIKRGDHSLQGFINGNAPVTVLLD